MTALSVEQMNPDATLYLRKLVLRPHQSYAELSAETAIEGMFAIGALVDRVVQACALAHPEAFGARPDLADSWRIRGMAADPASRGQGLGTLVLDRLLDELRLRDAAVAWCNARTPAMALYRRAGFEVVGEPWEDPEIGPHVRMWRMLR